MNDKIVILMVLSAMLVGFTVRPWFSRRFYKVAGRPHMDLVYIVFNPDWPAPPTVWFETRSQAERVAKMLSMRQPFDHFYVMKAVSVTKALEAGRVVELPGGES